MVGPWAMAWDILPIFDWARLSWAYVPMVGYGLPAWIRARARASVGLPLKNDQPFFRYVGAGTELKPMLEKVEKTVEIGLAFWSAICGHRLGHDLSRHQGAAGGYNHRSQRILLYRIGICLRGLLFTCHLDFANNLASAKQGERYFLSEGCAVSTFVSFAGLHCVTVWALVAVTRHASIAASLVYSCRSPVLPLLPVPLVSCCWSLFDGVGDGACALGGTGARSAEWNLTNGIAGWAIFRTLLSGLAWSLFWSLLTVPLKMNWSARMVSHA